MCAALVACLLAGADNLGLELKYAQSGKPSASASVGCCLFAAMTTEPPGLPGAAVAVFACDAVRIQGLHGRSVGPGSVSCDMTCDTDAIAKGLAACDAG